MVGGFGLWCVVWCGSTVGGHAGAMEGCVAVGPGVWFDGAQLVWMSLSEAGCWMIREVEDQS